MSRFFFQSRFRTKQNKTLTRLWDSLLRDSRVVILDESSASLDRELDEKLQLVIREEFKGSVVLTIAHRLQVSTFLSCFLAFGPPC